MPARNPARGVSGGTCGMGRAEACFGLVREATIVKALIGHCEAPMRQGRISTGTRNGLMLSETVGQKD
jgi:hypothetical protein